jgi:glycosyl transferase family 2
MASRLVVILPALDEADALPSALAGRPCDVPVVVVDNGSTDATPLVARSLGALVVSEPRRGFGSACARGVEAAAGADVVAFMDADASCDWTDLPLVSGPVLAGELDLVLGRRVRKLREPKAMPRHVALANGLLGLACAGGDAGNRARLHDCGPFRAIRRDALLELGMCELGYGWPLEMVLRARRAGLRIGEVPVHYRRRVGTSKVTGSVGGTVRATCRMSMVLGRFAGRRS